MRFSLWAVRGMLRTRNSLTGILEVMPVRRIFAVLALVLVGACSTLKTDPTANWSAERFYREGKAALDRKTYNTAIKDFETLEARYPYGIYAEQAQLDVAYAYYKDNQMPSAVDAANRFIRLHPTYPHVDYAYYLKGLANFNRHQSIFASLFADEDMTARDTKDMRDSYETFRELVERFPNSRYAPDSRKRMAYLINFLAKSEINIARFYFKRRAYVAAVNRAKYVIDHYQRTQSVEDALGIQAMAYKKMGMEELMNDSLRVLEKNFPNSRYIGQVKALSAG